MNEWNAIDLHIHTCKGYTRDKTEDNVNFTYFDFWKVIEKYNLKLMAVTNHNKIDMINYILLRHLCKYNKTNILLGVELDSNLSVGTHIHIACIFNDNFDENYDAYNNINLMTSRKLKRDDEIYYTDDEIIKILQKYDLIMIPHGDKDKGIFKNADSEQIKEALKKIREGFIRIFDSPSNWKLEKIKEYLRSINDSNLDIFGGVLFSDNRDWQKYDLKFRNFYMNAEPTFKGLIHSTTNPVKRFKHKTEISLNNNYISKIILKSNEKGKIKSTTINFSSAYNCIIGKSGTGKSLLIHLIRNKLDKEYIDKNDNYDFSENTEIEIYNEKGELLNNENINIGMGEKLFDKIITATSTNDVDDYYKIIELLDKTFIKQETFNQFKKDYNDKVQKYSKLSIDIKLNKDILITNINKYNSHVEQYLALKDIKTFEVNAVQKKEKQIYNKGDLEKFEKYYLYFDNIDNSIEIYKGKYSKDIEENYLKLKQLLLKARNEIEFEIEKYNIYDKKISIINKMITDINSAKSTQASVKSKLNIEIPNERQKIIEIVLNIYRNIRIKNNYDLSIKKHKYNSEKIINKKENIVVKEYLNEDIFRSVNEKNNDIFNTYGKKGLLNQNNNYDLNKNEDAKALIDKYIECEIISSQKNVISESLSVIVDVLFDNQNVRKLNPGTIAKKYIELYFEENVNSGNKNVVLFDQIENDVDKEFINKVIKKLIEDTKGNVQLIVVTHDPIIAVNADPNNYIESKKSGDLIEYRSFVAESSLNDELETIACTVDGSKDVIRGRYEIYEGDKDYGN